MEPLHFDEILAEGSDTHFVRAHERLLPSGETIWVDGDGDTSICTQDGWVQSNPGHSTDLTSPIDISAEGFHGLACKQVTDVHFPHPDTKAPFGFGVDGSHGGWVDVGFDLDHNDVPDRWNSLTDLDDNGVPDRHDFQFDLDGDGVPDRMDSHFDLNHDGIPDRLEPFRDINANGIPDSAEFVDMDHSGIPDGLDCYADMNHDGIPDYLQGLA